MDDEGPLPEIRQSIMDNADMEGFDLNKIMHYSHEKGILILLCELNSGEILPVPFEQLKQGCSYETSECVQEMVIG